MCTTCGQELTSALRPLSCSELGARSSGVTHGRRQGPTWRRTSKGFYVPGDAATGRAGDPTHPGRRQIRYLRGPVPPHETRVVTGVTVADPMRRLRGLQRNRRHDRWTWIEPEWWIAQQDPAQQLSEEEWSALLQG